MVLSDRCQFNNTGNRFPKIFFVLSKKKITFAAQNENKQQTINSKKNEKDISTL
jgi:hypothetical protein